MVFTQKAWPELDGSSWYCCNQWCGHRWGADLDPPVKWQFAAAVFKLLKGDLQRTSSWTQIPVTVVGAKGKEIHPLADILRRMVGQPISTPAVVQAHDSRLRVVQSESQMRAEIVAGGNEALIARLERATQEEVADIWLEMQGDGVS